MQLSQLFANVLSNPKQLKIQSKQQFFNTKPRQKRMKKSTCFSQQIENSSPMVSDLDNSTASYKAETYFKGCCKQLQSTFGQDNILSFKSKPPKRKRNNIMKSINESKRQSSGQSSDSDLSVSKSSLFRKKSPQFASKIIIPQKNKQMPINKFSISNFYIISKIGEGSYSQVYKAIQKNTGFICAIKILEKQKMKQMSVQQNVIRQIKINMFLDHPNIAKLYGCFNDKHHIYLICEYATHKNIYEVIKQPKSKKKDQIYDKATKLISQICQAVRYIHKNMVIHRDLKPQNILLTMNNTIKICDFGWSVYNPTKQLRLTLCGTPLYLAPQMIAQNYYDDSIDIWAIGIITYQLLTQESPFKITQLRDLCKIIHDEIDLSLIENPDAKDFIKNALQKDFKKRKCIFELCNNKFLSRYFESNKNQ